MPASRIAPQNSAFSPSFLNRLSSSYSVFHCRSCPFVCGWFRTPILEYLAAWFHSCISSQHLLFHCYVPITTTQDERVKCWNPFSIVPILLSATINRQIFSSVASYILLWMTQRRTHTFAVFSWIFFFFIESNATARESSFHFCGSLVTRRLQTAVLMVDLWEQVSSQKGVASAVGIPDEWTNGERI
jgi:hypothetical protein